MTSPTSLFSQASGPELEVLDVNWSFQSFLLDKPFGDCDGKAYLLRFVEQESYIAQLFMYLRTFFFFKVIQIKTTKIGAGEMAHQIKVLAVKADNLHSILGPVQ